MRPTLALLISPALLAGCLSSEGLYQGPAEPLPVPVREYSHDGLRFVSLEPFDVGRATTLEGSVSLYVGALYVGSMDADEGEHTLALVLQTVNKDGVPILTSGSDLLLDVDGTYLVSNPRPGGHTYKVEGNGGEVTETVMVPLDPATMSALAEADVVRGRLGPWFSFVLPRSNRAVLTEILGEIPSGVRHHLAKTTPGRIASE